MMNSLNHSLNNSINFELKNMEEYKITHKYNNYIRIIFSEKKKQKMHQNKERECNKFQTSMYA